ncbi:MAG: ATP-binding cassette domain-containing protein [Muribaculaceae bacterium]|nr:ATP-binding cassette domain-containing protein [Muribaculaceae bacterium]MBQ7211797.1 ATP-binding cassette domain-containing protein [Muribaculaceae bacterium]
MNLIDYKEVNINRKELMVLKDVNFSLKEGEFVYLLGGVGSGKSSLLKSVYAEIGIESAKEAIVLDYDLMRLRRRDVPYLRRKVGVVFQDFQLLTDRSVFENLRFVLRATRWKNPAEIAHRIEEVLAAVGMDGKEYKMPHELSGGEQQRVVIARALLNKPKIILADEPTGNLDPDAGRQIVQLLNSIVDKGTASVVMATHNVGLVEEFPHTVYRIENKQLLVDK